MAIVPVVILFLVQYIDIGKHGDCSNCDPVSWKHVDIGKHGDCSSCDPSVSWKHVDVDKHGDCSISVQVNATCKPTYKYKYKYKYKNFISIRISRVAYRMLVSPKTYIKTNHKV